MIQLPPCLDERFKRAAEIAKKSNFFRVIAHYDADGVSSASIIYSALLNEKKEFHISFLKHVSRDNLQNLLNGKADAIILLDTGSSMISFLENYENVIVLDHHPPEKDSEKVLHVNPHFCNYSGTTDGCGSTLAYIFSLYMNEENWKNYHSFLAGVVGDRQHLNGYSGLNKMLVNYIEEKGIKRVSDITLEGQTVKEMLLMATDPFLVDYTGNEKNVLSLLDNLGINPDKNPGDLTDDERSSLYSWIALQLLKRDVETDIIQGIITEKHYIEKYGMYDISLSNYIDAAARMNRQGMALSFLAGNESEKDELIDSWVSFKNILIEELYSGLKNVIGLDHIQYFYVNEDSMAGAVSGILMSYALNRNKPVVGIHDSNGEAHISARATKTLVAKGVDLGKGMKICAEKNGGSGGGHNIAAGATVPSSNVKNFLTCLNSEIGEQLVENK